MLQLNLEALGVTEQALEQAILSELGMSKEQAVQALADKFGVALAKETPAAPAVKTGDLVATDQGEARALVISESDLRAVTEGLAVAKRLFG